MKQCLCLCSVSISDIDECAITHKKVCPMSNSVCVNSVGSHKCNCKPGYRMHLGQCNGK